MRVSSRYPMISLLAFLLFAGCALFCRHIVSPAPESSSIRHRADIGATKALPEDRAAPESSTASGASATLAAQTSSSASAASGASAETPSSSEMASWMGKHAFAGYPRSVSPRSAFILLENIGYDIGYSENYKTPVWAVYRCAWIADAKSPGPRPARFRTDKRTTARVRHEDYAQADYATAANPFDRGHMAPNFAIGSRYGRQAQLETFLMSNVCPQRAALNQQTWEALEERIAGEYAQECNIVWVVVGPIFGETTNRLNGVAAIPEAFYMILLDVHGNALRALAVQMNQDVSGAQPLRPYVVTIRKIEQEAGLDFFSELPDATQESLETSAPDPAWDIDAVMKPNDGQ